MFDGFGLIMLLFALVGVVATGLKLVPQGATFTVNRFGRHLRSIGPGVHFIVPFIDSIDERRPDTK